MVPFLVRAESRLCKKSRGVPRESVAKREELLSKFGIVEESLRSAAGRSWVRLQAQSRGETPCPSTSSARTAEELLRKSALDHWARPNEKD